jgi:hypothetical protein
VNQRAIITHLKAKSAFKIALPLKAFYSVINTAEEGIRDAHSGNYSEDTFISKQRWQIDSSDIKRSSSIMEHGKASDQEWKELFSVRAPAAANAYAGIVCRDAQRLPGGG